MSHTISRRDNSCSAAPVKKGYVRLARDTTSHSHERQVVAFGQSFNTRAQGDATARTQSTETRINVSSSACVSCLKRATVDAVSVSHTFSVRDTAHVSSFPVTSQDHRRRYGRPPRWRAREKMIKRPHRKVRTCAATRDGIRVVITT